MKKATVKEANSPRKVDDFLKIDSYTLLVILFSEFITLSGTGNYSYMIFAGAAPKAVTCVDDLSNACADLKYSPNCTYSMDYEFKSVNVEFGYVCGQTAAVKTSISVQMVGVLLGNLLTGYLSDRFGRLKVLMLSHLATSLLGIACTFAYDLYSFTFIRTMQGIFLGGLISTSSVYMTEHIPKRHRFLVSTIVGWSFNFILAVLLAFYSPEWRAFQLNLVLVSSPAIILYWFVYESPRWLLQHGHLEEARRVLLKSQERGSAITIKEIDSLISSHYETKTPEGQRKIYTWRHIFSDRFLGFAFLLISIGSFISSMTNYAMVFNLEKLSGSIFWNAIILAAIRWSITLFIGFLDFKAKCVGRKAVHFVAQILVGFCLLVIAVLFCFGIESEYRSIIRGATIAALAMSTQIYVTKNIVMMELFPTVIRSQAMSLKSVISRFGVILSPLLFVITPWQTLPYAALTILAFLNTALFQAYIPETKGRSLPDHLPEKSKDEPLLRDNNDNSA